MNEPNVFKNPCAICKKREAVKLCDYIIKYDNSVIFFRDRTTFNKVNSPGYKHQTCDLPLCKQCAKNEGQEVDFCPYHHKLYLKAELPEELKKAQWKEKLKHFESTQFEGE